MKTVKIYKNTCTQGVMIGREGDGFSLYPWGQDTSAIKGYDDGGKDYVLPDGYELAEFANQQGKMGIFKGDCYCDIHIHTSGHPQLVCGDLNEMPVLIEAKELAPET